MFQKMHEMQKMQRNAKYAPMQNAKSTKIQNLQKYEK